jgi:putative membrane protein
VHHVNNRRAEDGHSMWKGAVAGMAGGLVASWVMNQFQAAISSRSGGGEGDHAERERRRAGNDASQQESDSENATAKTADAVSETLMHRTLTKSEKGIAGPLVHYAFGSAMGTMYGVAAELAPRTATGWGLPFGTALWFGADEVAVPAFGLSKFPTEYPPSTHASALATHLVYGLSTDLVRRAVRAAL